MCTLTVNQRYMTNREIKKSHPIRAFKEFQVQVAGEKWGLYPVFHVSMVPPDGDGWKRRTPYTAHKKPGRGKGRTSGCGFYAAKRPEAYTDHQEGYVVLPVK